MRKLILSLFLLICLTLTLQAQSNLSIGVVSQKTQNLYWENGLGLDYSSEQLLNNHLHLKAAAISSRLGSAINSNAINQESYTIGADWHFFSSKALQLSTGLNGGFFIADYEDARFDMLSNKSGLAQFELGLHYSFKLPIHISSSVVYNIINSDGKQGAGTLFPLAYQIKLYYKIK